jgi:hypothetical protein
MTRISADKSQESKRKISGNPSDPRYQRSIPAKLRIAHPPAQKLRKFPLCCMIPTGRMRVWPSTRSR